MASSGPNSGGTFANDTTVGNASTWNDISFVSSSNNSRANFAVNPGGLKISNYIKCTNFGFSIPSGATIDGIVVEVERLRSSNVNITPADYSVKLVKGGTISGDEKSAGATITTTDTYATFGSSSDLWSVTLTDTDVNASTFGCVYALQGQKSGKGAGYMYVDHIRLTVYYTASGGGSSSNSLLMAGD